MIELPKQIYENVKIPFIKFAVNIGVTGNQVTIINHALTLTFGCYFFSRGTYIGGLLGLFVMCVNGFLDYLDGDLARIRKEDSKLGNWLDSGFDVVIQNAVMGSIAIGCYKQGLPLVWIVLFYIGNTSSNFVSFFYNQKFGFASSSGNKLFREMMDQKGGIVNGVLRDIIDPTSHAVALIIFTYRYFITLGALFMLMPSMFVLMVIITNMRWSVMYYIYAVYLRGDNNLHVLHVLKRLDDEQAEFYSIRQGGEESETLTE